MSFNLNEVHRLRRLGGAVLAKYERLVAAADQSQHGSPAEAELGAFRLAWLADPIALTQHCEQEAGAEVAEAQTEEQAADLGHGD
jgi:hypothetical protein